MILESSVDPRDPDFVANDRHNRRLLADLHARYQRVLGEGRAVAVERHLGRGKLLPRERIECLLDRNTSFLELSSLCAEEMYDGAAPGAGIVTGIGVVGDNEILVVANDPTVKAGTYFPLTVAKQLRAQRIAEENRLPCVYLVDSGGAYLPLQSEIFPQ